MGETAGSQAGDRGAKGTPVRRKRRLVIATLAILAVGLGAWVIWHHLTKPKEITLDLGNNVKMRLVLIPAGKFVMGSPDNEPGHLPHEGPQHEVVITKPFYMSACHVTRGQFAAFIADSGYQTDAEKDGWTLTFKGDKYGRVDGVSWKKGIFDQTDDHPVVLVSHNDARAFCEWLSKKANKQVALPSEAQWEYACRAGSQTAYQWGDDPDDGKGWCNAGDQTWKKARSLSPNNRAFGWDDGYVFTSPVGKFRANAFGLFDMHGNVWQWCADWYAADYYANSPKADPQGPGTGEDRIVRGGCWLNIVKACRSAFRFRGPPNYRNVFVGFRVVVSPGGD